MPDVFIDEPSAPPIVDCDVLEAAKENIQPLASGRRVTALSAILSTPHAQRENRLADARRRHRANVEIAMEDEDDDADPLEAYSRFVYWTVENYPQGHSAESGLLELLEEATRVLRDDRGGKWRGDLRYLKLWTLYASYVDKPTIIYKYLLVNEIGTAHALFYEEYAMALERAGRCVVSVRLVHLMILTVVRRVDADETYMLGIARKAAPLERLEAKHREFQKRMMASPSLPSSSSTSTTDPDASSATTAPRRRPLGEPAASSSSSRTRSSRAGSTRAPSISEDVFAAPAAPRPNGRMPVFVDPSGDAENDPDQATNPTPWPELGTRKSRIKENTVEVSKAAGSTLRQAGKSRRVASGPKIAVFRDPGPSENPAEDMPPPPVPAVKKKEKGKSGSKSSISIFCDEEASNKPEPSVPSTPKFVPFRDEESDAHATSTSILPATAMKSKPAPAEKHVAMSAEGEALRKDPFKNYDPDEKPIED
ncbi:Mad3/BUB1 homology region 1-domain-containing protein [Cubamyces menziesii]|nr:Mad3/BUB1 homology region 1-domain-containing protein [Cubamyces menziesii]